MKCSYVIAHQHQIIYERFIKNYRFFDINKQHVRISFILEKSYWWCLNLEIGNKYWVLMCIWPEVNSEKLLEKAERLLKTNGVASTNQKPNLNLYDPDQAVTKDTKSVCNTWLIAPESKNSQTYEAWSGKISYSDLL